MPGSFPLRPLLLALSLAYAGLAGAAVPDANTDADTDADLAAVDGAVPPAPAVMPVVTVSGTAAAADAYSARSSKSASRLDLTLRETPQSVSVVTRALMDDFQLTTINDVLASATGVTVEKVETSRTYSLRAASTSSTSSTTASGCPRYSATCRATSIPRSMSASTLCAAPMA